MMQPAPPPALAATTVDRVAMLAVHTSPLDQPGTGDGGGLNVYVREVASRLVERGVQVDVYTRATAPDAPARVEVDAGLSVHHVVAGPTRPLAKHELPNHLCAFALALQRHPSVGEHEIVHAHYWMSGWVGRRVAPRWGAPLVQTFHTLAVLKNATLAPGDAPESPLRLAAEARIAAEADHLAVLTCGEARLLYQRYGVSGARLSVVPPGVDLDTFGPGRVATSPRSDPELLFVGRLQPLKGPDVAVRTLAELRRTHPGARLTVVGGPSGNGEGRSGPAQLRALASELRVADAVEILPAVDQRRLAEHYRRADLTLVPSRSETFGLVALESQACGTPVVAADVTGLRTVVAGGTLVAGHDPADHAAAARRLLAGSGAYADAVARGLAQARRSSWDRTVDRLLALYGDATVRGQRRRRAS